MDLQEDSIQNFEPDMKYWQIKHTGWFNPKLLNQISSRQAEHTGCFHPKVLVLFKIWMESPCMFKLSILHVWLKNFGWNHPVCSNKYWQVWTYRVIPSERFEPDMKYWQIEHTGWFHPKVLNQTWSTDKLNIQGGSI
jgi:hypothetical protein